MHLLKQVHRLGSRPLVAGDLFYGCYLMNRELHILTDLADTSQRGGRFEGVELLVELIEVRIAVGPYDQVDFRADRVLQSLAHDHFARRPSFG